MGALTSQAPQRLMENEPQYLEAKDFKECNDILVHIILLLFLYCYVHFSMFTRVTWMYNVLSVGHCAGRILTCATPVGDHG